MIVDLYTNKDNKIDWNSKGVDRIIQNCWLLINTWRYEVAYDRIKGIDPSIIDMPSSETIALYISEIYRIIDTYEPRANVLSVEYLDMDNEGNMEFKVVIEV